MNTWLWTLTAVSSYLAGWWVTPFMLVEMDRRFPDKNLRGNPDKLREKLREDLSFYPAFSLAWPVAWLIMGLMILIHVHEKPLRRQVDRPFPEEIERLAAQRKREQEAHVRALEEANGIGRTE